jgi:hypothetical protein
MAKVESFLFNVPTYEEKLSAYPRAGNEALPAKLDELIHVHTTKARHARD